MTYARPQLPIGGRGVSLTWLGVAGWAMTFDGRTVLVDPYLSRFDYRFPDGSGIDPSVRLVVDEAIVETVIAAAVPSAPEVVLLSHGHWDHMADVPYLLDRSGSGSRDWSAATVRTIGTESHWHLLNAMGVSERRLASVIVARGGEWLDFGGFTVQTLPSLHSQFSNFGYFAPGTVTAPPRRVRTIGDLVEGGTLLHQVNVSDRVSVLFTGASNFNERDLTGMRPDVLVVTMTTAVTVYRYLERLLTTLGAPSVLIPCHHDDLITPLTDPNIASTVSQEAVDLLRTVVRDMGLASEVIAPRHLEPIAL